MSNSVSDSDVSEVASEGEQFVAEECKNSDYGNAFLDTLNKMRIDQMNCDFSLEVEGETIYVHRLALAVASPYFAAMFKNNMKEKAVGSIKYEDNNLTAVKNIIEYIYSGQITLTEENVQAIYSTSDYFQIAWVKKKCLQFLVRNIRLDNCFQIRRFADKPPFKELYECCYNYILENFDKLINNEELLRLSFEEIQELIKDDRLSVKLEENAYKAVINWIKYDLEERKTYLAKLMSHVRLVFVKTEFLRDCVANESLLQNDLQCNKFLIQGLSYQLAPVSKQSSLLSQIKDIPRNRNAKVYVVLAGGRDLVTKEAHRTCKIYDVANSKISRTADMNNPRARNSVIALNNAVYAVGGHDDGRLRSAEHYDVDNQKWTHIAPMNNARDNFGICAYNDLIYVIGGRNVSSVENYRVATNKWYACPDVTIAECTRATVVENAIYSLCCGSDGIILCTRFDPREGQWSELNRVPGGPHGIFELCAYDRSLFFIAKDCARFDTRINKWESMPSMLSERYAYSAAIVADDIYVLGGRTISSDWAYVQSVESFNIHNNEWTAVDTIEIELWTAGASVISGDFYIN
uniref:Kelch-like protein diablo n=1 Tax=Glossina brevipalpis TaxID=37001 RepID=A0A1A9W9A1_9MUSC